MFHRWDRSHPSSLLWSFSTIPSVQGLLFISIICGCQGVVALTSFLLKKMILRRPMKNGNRQKSERVAKSGILFLTTPTETKKRNKKKRCTSGCNNLFVNENTVLFITSVVKDAANTLHHQTYRETHGHKNRLSYPGARNRASRTRTVCYS